MSSRLSLLPDTGDQTPVSGRGALSIPSIVKPL